MSATILTDPMAVQAPEPTTTTTTTTTTKPATATQTDVVEFAKCDCCGLIEECTQEYIERTRERYQGKWICGLCAEVIKDEIIKTSERLISTEEAMTKHMNYCKRFRSPVVPPPDPTIHLISAMRQVLRRSLDSPRRGLRSTPNSPTIKNVEDIRRPALTRSESCFPTLSG